LFNGLYVWLFTDLNVWLLHCPVILTFGFLEVSFVLLWHYIVI